jgi:hypothetical protein
MVLCDLGMVKMNGIDFLEQRRSNLFEGKRLGYIIKVL